MFQTLDINGDGVIDLNEFIRFCLEVSKDNRVRSLDVSRRSDMFPNEICDPHGNQYPVHAFLAGWWHVHDS